MTPQEKKDAYRAKEAARRAEQERIRKESLRSDRMYRWAKRYDDLNGRPESEYDR